MFGTDRRRKASTASAKIIRRVRKTPTEDLELWADQTMIATYQAFRSWQNTGESDMLSEAVMGSEALREVLEEIRRRKDTPFG